eukprot:gene16014-biopygen10124
MPRRGCVGDVPGAPSPPPLRVRAGDAGDAQRPPPSTLQRSPRHADPVPAAAAAPGGLSGMCGDRGRRPSRSSLVDSAGIRAVRVPAVRRALASRPYSPEVEDLQSEAMQKQCKQRKTDTASICCSFAFGGLAVGRPRPGHRSLAAAARAPRPRPRARSKPQQPREAAQAPAAVAAYS